MNKTVGNSAAILIALLNFTISDAQRISSNPCPPCPINSLCVNPCDTAWLTGSFITNGRNPIQINGKDFSVQRIAEGLYAIAFKKPFCCPISAVATTNIAGKTSNGFCIPGSPRSFSIGDASRNPVALAVSQDGNCLVTGNADTENLTTFGIDSVNCTLRLASTPMPVTAPGTVHGGMAFSPNGCLFATSPVENPTPQMPGHVSFFSVNNCALQLKQVISTDNPPESIFALTFAPGATCPLAVSRDQDGNYTLITIDASDCPPPGNPTRLGITNTPVAIAVSSKNCAAVLDENNTISLFKIVPSPCKITGPIGTFNNSPNTSGAIALAFAPSGKCLYILNRESNNISILNVNSDAAGNCSSLTDVPGSPISNEPGSDPIALAISPDGRCLAIANQVTNNISLFSVDPQTCKMIPIPGSPFDLPSDASGPTDILFSTNGKCLFVSNGDSNNVTVFPLNSLGEIDSSGTQICEAITPGCFILQLPPEADRCATVTFFATPCT